MGGEVFVGIKRSDCSEQCSLRWTNIMPSFLSDHTFWNEGTSFRDFIEKAKSDNEWPQSKLTLEIEPSEYGVILIDFVNKIIFSRQNYSAPGHLCLHLDDSEDLDEIKLLQKHGMLSRILDGMDRYEIDYADAITRDKSFVTVEYTIPGWEINHISDRASDCWSDVLEWLKQHDWNSPAWSIDKVNDDGGTIALMGVGTVKLESK